MTDEPPKYRDVFAEHAKQFANSETERGPKKGMWRWWLMFTAFLLFALYLVFPPLAMLLLLPFILLFYLLFGWLIYAIQDRRAESLPESVQVSEFLGSVHEDGFIEGCTAQVYRLAPITIEALSKHGVAAFNNDAKPRGQDYASNPFGPWRSTPAPDVYASGAFVCANDRRLRELLGTAATAASLGGGFYTLTANKEGMILVLPKERLAVFLYFG